MKDNKQKIKDIYPVALTIAGSDSGGGAGIQADLRTFSAFGVFGTSAITAVTAQNPCEVRNIEAVSSSMVKSQIEAVFAEFAVKSVKTGMLHNRRTVEIIAELLKGRNISLIVDPVMISTSGIQLIEDDAVETMKQQLFPVADWITPNIPEAEKLLNIKIASLKEMKKAATELATKYNLSCIIKGGHAFDKDKRALDVVSSNGNIFILKTPFIDFDKQGDSTLAHGTGCTFSAALAAGFALGIPWRDTLISSKAFVFGSLSEGVKPGDSLYAMYPPAGSYKNKVQIV